MHWQECPRGDRTEQRTRSMKQHRDLDEESCWDRGEWGAGRGAWGAACQRLTLLLVPDPGALGIILPLPAAQLKRVDRHGGADLLLGQPHAVVEHLEEALRLLLLVQLAVERILSRGKKK